MPECETRRKYSRCAGSTWTGRTVAISSTIARLQRDEGTFQSARAFSKRCWRGMPIKRKAGSFHQNGQSAAISPRWPGNSKRLGRMPACQNDLVLYCARHGFGTEMYRATKNLFAVMKAMGDAAVATTMKYQHHDIDEIAHVAAQRVQ